MKKLLFCFGIAFMKSIRVHQCLSVVKMCFLLLIAFSAQAQTSWQTRLDGRVNFYQTTDFGLLIAGTENSLYALEATSGEVVWRRGNGKLEQTSITPVPATDLILLSLERKGKSTLAAVDMLTGDEIWESDKVKGEVMQLAVEPDLNLLCVVLVKNPRGDIGETIKREPTVAVFELSSGELLWKRDLGGEVEMMPAELVNFSGKTAFTLDNYRAPLILDGRIFLFYEGATSFEARSGKEREREKFKVNEEGLALTEADAVFDEKRIYTSGRGRIRAVNRKSGEVEWEAKDLGVTPEMFLGNNVLYVRTGGQFTRLKDGETVEKGAFGISAIDTKKGKTLWRFKGADKGLTNFVFLDENTILIADRDELIAIDAGNGKKKYEFEHKVEKAQFILINEFGNAVIGGRDTLAAFDLTNPQFQKANFRKDLTLKPIWIAKYKAPSRGLLKTILSIAARATALYFRYGGLVQTGFNIFRGAQFIQSVSSLRWSGLKARFASIDLTGLATNYARNYVGQRIRTFGIASRAQSLGFLRPDGSFVRPDLPRLPNLPRGGDLLSRVAPSRSDVKERLLEKLDPIRQLERLSDWLGQRKRLAELRGNYMYYYTETSRGKGLVGVNIHTGQKEREIPLSDPDAQFVTDEVNSILFSADGNRILAFDLMN